MKKVIIVLMLFVSIHADLCAQDSKSKVDKAFEIPENIIISRRFYINLEKGNKLEIDLTDITDLQKIANIDSLLGGVQLVLDGTDNFETRYLLNDYSIKNSIPWIYTAAVGSYGVTLNVLPGRTACLACIFPDPPQGTVETCETAGVLGPVVNMIAAIGAAEAIKILVGAEEKIRRTLLSFDIWENERGEVAARNPRPGCRACGEHNFIHLAGEGRPHITLCGRNSVQIHERNRPIDFREIGKRLHPHGTVRHNDFVLKFWRDPYEMTLFPDGRAIIKGTTDTAIARSLYARYVGN